MAGRVCTQAAIEGRVPCRCTVRCVMEALVHRTLNKQAMNVVVQCVAGTYTFTYILNTRAEVHVHFTVHDRCIHFPALGPSTSVGCFHLVVQNVFLNVLFLSPTLN